MRTSERGFTLIELLIVVALIGILAGISAHHVLAAKAAANEASAIGTLRALNSAQQAYSATCARGSFSPTFARLVTGKYASPDMNLSPKSGYLFELADGTGVDGEIDCDGAQAKTAYYATGVPVSNLNGTRGFATNQVATIWQDLNGVAPAEPFTFAGSVSPIQAH